MKKNFNNRYKKKDWSTSEVSNKYCTQCHYTLWKNEIDDPELPNDRHRSCLIALQDSTDRKLDHLIEIEISRKKVNKNKLARD